MSDGTVGRRGLDPAVIRRLELLPAWRDRLAMYREANAKRDEGARLWAAGDEATGSRYEGEARVLRVRADAVWAAAVRGTLGDVAVAWDGDACTVEGMRFGPEDEEARS